MSTDVYDGAPASQSGSASQAPVITLSGSWPPRRARSSASSWSRAVSGNWASSGSSKLGLVDRGQRHPLPLRGAPDLAQHPMGVMRRLHEHERVAGCERHRRAVEEVLGVEALGEQARRLAQLEGALAGRDLTRADAGEHDQPLGIGQLLEPRLRRPRPARPRRPARGRRGRDPRRRPRAPAAPVRRACRGRTRCRSGRARATRSRSPSGQPAPSPVIESVSAPASRAAACAARGKADSPVCEITITPSPAHGLARAAEHEAHRAGRACVPARPRQHGRSELGRVLARPRPTSQMRSRSSRRRARSGSVMAASRSSAAGWAWIAFSRPVTPGP